MTIPEDDYPLTPEQWAAVRPLFQDHADEDDAADRAVSEIEAKARLRNEIRPLADQIDRGADLFLGTTLSSLLKTTGRPLHELTLDELEAAHGDLLSRRARLGWPGGDSG